MKRKILSLIITLFLTLGVALFGCSNVTNTILGPYEYEIRQDEDGKYAVIIGYDDLMTDLVIPLSINVNGEEIPVIVIESFAFFSCSSLTSIYIPSSVKTIGEGAFSDCSSLTSIYISDSVTIIESYAFYNCSNLTIYCEASSKPRRWLSKWNYSDRPVVWSSNGEHGEYSDFTYGVCIDNEGNPYLTITGYTGSSTNVAIPTSININGEDIPVKAIADNAFYKNETITSIAIPDSVTTIGSFAFLGCSSLTSIIIPDSVTTIGDYAFYYCSNLTTVKISENSQLTTIGDRAFYDCSSLTSIYIPDSVIAIGEFAFRFCSNLTIYCEASYESAGWDWRWNDFDRPVIWNVTYEEYLSAISK